MSVEKNPEREQPETAPNFAILNQIEFYDDLRNEVLYAFAIASSELPKRPKLWARAMVVEYGHSTAVLFNILEKSARLGFDAKLILDPFSNYVPEGTSRFKPVFNKDRPLSKKINQERLSQLKEAGVDVAYTNPQTTLKERIMFMKGRSHKKIAVISTPNRQVAYMGGMNFWDAHFDYIDYMVKLDDPRIVTAIIDEFPRINENRRREDAKIKCTEDTSLLIDCGKPGESIILNKAIRQVESATQRIICASELPPQGQFLEALNQAYRKNVAVFFITNDPRHEPLELKLQKTLDRLTLKQKRQEFPTLHPSMGVHAKLLIIDNKTVIAGSNNFHPSTVNYGTEEAALISTNSTLVTNAISYAEDIMSSHLTVTRDRIQ